MCPYIRVSICEGGCVMSREESGLKGTGRVRATKSKQIREAEHSRAITQWGHGLIKEHRESSH